MLDIRKRRKGKEKQAQQIKNKDINSHVKQIILTVASFILV